MREEPAVIFSRIRDNVARAIVGREAVTEAVLAAMAAGGHVLIEDVPGTGKTTLVSAVARSLDLKFSRIQFTPDVLPSDVTGYTALDFRTGERTYVEGAVIANVVLADEINRTSPKTQSALLEVMAEGAVTVDGVSHTVPQPFTVLATQNPVEHVGTYPLPEAQLDRFMMKISMGYPDAAQEKDILRRNRAARPVDALEPVASAADMEALRAERARVVCSDSVLEYIVALTSATRRDGRIRLGVSPRGSIALMEAATAMAMLRGREYVTPDDVQALAPSVLAHRLVPAERVGAETAAELLRGIIRTVKVPGVK